MASIASVLEYRMDNLLASKPDSSEWKNEQIQSHLDSASDYFESMLYQNVRQTEEIEPMRHGTQRCATGPDGVLLITPRFFPLVSISSVKYRTTPAQDWSVATAFATTDYAVEMFKTSNYSWGAHIIVPFANPFDRSTLWGEVQVDYFYGYDSGDMPGDVKRAVIMLAYIEMTLGFSLVANDTEESRSLVPAWVLSEYVDPVISRYKRQF